MSCDTPAPPWTCTARSITCWPAGVTRERLRPSRTKIWKPSSSSSSLICFDTPGWEGILKHGCYHQRKGLGIDESVMWGEYFFCEALESALRENGVVVVVAAPEEIVKVLVIVGVSWKRRTFVEAVHQARGRVAVLVTDPATPTGPAPSAT